MLTVSSHQRQWALSADDTSTVHCIIEVHLDKEELGFMPVVLRNANAVLRSYPLSFLWSFISRRFFYLPVVLNQLKWYATSFG